MRLAVGDNGDPIKLWLFGCGLISGKEQTPVSVLDDLPDKKRAERRNRCERGRNAGVDNTRTDDRIDCCRSALAELDTEEILRTSDVGRKIARPQPSGIGRFIKLAANNTSPIELGLLRRRKIARPEPSGVGSFVELRSNDNPAVEFRLLGRRLVPGSQPVAVPVNDRLRDDERSERRNRDGGGGCRRDATMSDARARRKTSGGTGALAELGAEEIRRNIGGDVSGPEPIAANPFGNSLRDNRGTVKLGQLGRGNIAGP